MAWLPQWGDDKVYWQSWSGWKTEPSLSLENKVGWCLIIFLPVVIWKVDDAVHWKKKLLPFKIRASRQLQKSGAAQARGPGCNEATKPSPSLKQNNHNETQDDNQQNVVLSSSPRCPSGLHCSHSIHQQLTTTSKSPQAPRHPQHRTREWSIHNPRLCLKASARTAFEYWSWCRAWYAIGSGGHARYLRWRREL